ncbi:MULTISPECIES: dihydrolipoyl dehydrogenase [Bacteroidota]|jgi:dihydrolipoamide dehydrogenase|uniref:Dihydrolipoyl dehydrogenase n=1 Tax=Paenimyroides ummariense TaxID=913024 RepID=A0A1I4Z208_9FLAO|nr:MULTISPECIES: dihydrolipoyl dehydrogenase [Bacteroidota]KUG10613.1 dihydrolipoamide dehydrogenase [Elizabethkingia miricola]PLK43990.1 dihydrolipoyl dehydrogenase [Emticicia sp. TH156]SFN44207.1 dihydrolipoamide dehydrogenase [Paenimyroides ummariense]
MESQFDVIIIGSGPGGYVTAIRCAQLGLKTAIIEKYSVLGGTCLNVGCIPSKAMLDSSERYHEIKYSSVNHGIDVDNTRVDLKRMIARKADVVSKINGGVSYLMKKNKVEVFQGVGSFKNKNTILIKSETAEETITGANVIIATGSKPASLPGIDIDKKRIISSTEALNLKEIPKHLVVVGGGVIGMELGSVYGRLGSKITVIEYAGSILANMDKKMGAELQKSLKKNLDFEFLLGYKVTGATNTGDSIAVTAEDKNGDIVTLESDYCLVAIGRKPYTTGLGLDKVGIELNSRGQISTDKNMETNVKGIYAIGDVVEGPMLAHKASEEGIFVAEIIAGQKPHINYNTIPSIVYTSPEVASVGKTEEELKTSGIKYKVGQFPFSASGRAITSGKTEGVAKVLADAKTDEILGFHIIGERASDLIGEATVSMAYRAAAEDIARISHGHPTYYENLREACLDVEKIAIHI